MPDTFRTHDQFYLREDGRNNPKEYFKFLVEMSHQRTMVPLKHAAIADIGCAAGDFLHYLSQVFPQASLHGLEVSPPLLETARQRVPHATFEQCNIDATDVDYGKDRFDLIYMAGVHSIFDTCDRWVHHVTRLLKLDGTAFVFGLFNSLPYDVLVRVRKAGADQPYESGWNVFSRETVEAALTRCGCSVDFVPWNVPLDLPFRPDDPLRAWTVPLADGSRAVVNATRVWHEFYCAVIVRGGPHR